MATIEARSGSWSVCWRKGTRRGGNKPTRERVTFHSETLALRAKRIAEAHHHDITRDEVERAVLGLPAPSSNGNGDPAMMTVAEWADLWLDTRTRIAPGQRRRYRSQLDRIVLPAIGHMPLDQVEGRHIVAILQGIRDAGRTEGAGTATADRYYSLLHSLFGYAVREKKLDDNPARRTDWIRDLTVHDDAGDDGDDHVYLTQAEYQRIRAYLGPHARMVADYLAGTGARWSEATAATVDSIDRSRAVPAARVYRAWKQDGEGRWYIGATKGRNRRSVPVSVALVAELAPAMGGQPDDALLLRAPRGGRWNHSNFVNRHWAPAVAAAMRCDEHPPAAPAKGARGPARKLRVDEVSTCDCPGRLRVRPTPHDLRHSHAAWQIAAGHPIAAISRRLGHRSTETTERIYAGILPEVAEAMADVADGVFSGGVGLAGVGRRRVE